MHGVARASCCARMMLFILLGNFRVLYRHLTRKTVGMLLVRVQGIGIHHYETAEGRGTEADPFSIY